MNDIGSAIAGSRAKRGIALLTCISSGAAAVIAASFLVEFFIQLNLHVLRGAPWFLVPVTIAVAATLRHTLNDDSSTRSKSLSPRQSLLIASGLAITLGLLAAWLTGIQKVSTGNVLLPGDRYAATAAFQIAATVATMIAAGIFEEFGVRRFVQFRLSRFWHPHFCEALAGLLFVALHFFRFHVGGQIFYVLLLGFVCGRFASATQSVIWPMVIHVVANLTAMALVFAGRSF